MKLDESFCTGTGGKHSTTAQSTPLGGYSTMAFAGVSRPVVVVGESVCDALFAHAGQG